MVSEFTGAPPETLTPETTLFYDLGIDGDDAIEFFDEFRKSFGVDLTEFKIESHFGPEASGPISSMVTWFRGWWIGDHHRAAGVVPISLHNLVLTAQAGRWVRPTLRG